jgi:hypothetical protein
VTSKPSPPDKGRPGDPPVFQIREIAQADGGPDETITFTGTNIQPLGYAELAQAKPHKKLTISLQMRNSTIIDTGIEHLDKSLPHDVKMTIESSFTSRAIGLIRGGWLPPVFAADRVDTIILIDRNIVSEIVGRFKHGKVVGAEPDFIDLFADRPVRINPVLFAMEGNGRRVPTPADVRDQLEEAVSKLQAALPSAKLMVGPGSLKGALGLIEDAGPGIARKQQFLMRIAPSLAAPVGRRNMQARRNEVLAAADECGVLRGSLVVLAALSAVFVPNGRSPAKKLLKFRVGYSQEDAYNALVDLRSLEVLIHLFTLFPDERILLCTADRDLALFWTGIRASNFERTGAGVSYALSPVKELLPGLAVDEWSACLGAATRDAERR